MRIGVILVAAGQGTRLGEPVPKGFVDLGGRPLFLYAAATLAGTPGVRALVTAVPAGTEARAGKHLRTLSAPGIELLSIAGGAERQDSVAKGLAALPSDCEVIVVHDAARPFVRQELIAECIRMAMDRGAAIAVRATTDTVKEVDSTGVVVRTLDRSRLVLVQTPQVFRKELLEAAHRRARQENFVATDDAALVEGYGSRVWTVMSDATNVKITTPEDLEWARWCLTRRQGPR